MNDVKAEKAWLGRYYRPLWDVSAFMKLPKQRFSQWYNRRIGRKGTPWEERFKSVWVDGAVFGGKGYVDDAFRAYRERFGAKRKTGARRLRGVDRPLYALRDSRLNVFG